MLSLYICIQLFLPVKNIAINSIIPSVVLHKSKFLILNPSPSNCWTNKCHFASSNCWTNKCHFALSCISESSGPDLETAISYGNSSNQYGHSTSYLVDSCGLSPEIAILASAKVNLKSPKRADSFLTFLREHGFSKTQIAKLVRKRPGLLLSNPEKTLLPKFEFFYSIGVTRNGIARTLSKDPTLLVRSLENQILPCYSFLKNVLKSDEKIVAAMRRTSWIFLENYNKNLAPNIGFLRELGVAESCVTLLLTHFPEALMQKHQQFKETTTQVKEMGFDPLKSMFVLAVHVLSGNGSTWDRCYEVYTKWGWSEDDILLAFRKHPQSMILSEKKISRAMEFLVNEMGQSSRAIARCPSVLFFSLEKRIIPRCNVVQALSLKGLMKKDVSLGTFLQPTEKRFLEKFVTKYKEEFPQLLGVYQGEVDAWEL